MASELAAQHGVTLRPIKEPHISFFSAYQNPESEKLMEIVRRHLHTPLALTAADIRVGDVAPYILLRLIPTKTLNALFWESYNTLGKKKHTLINGEYDPHITIAAFNKEDRELVKAYLVKFRDKYKNKIIQVDALHSYGDERGQKIELHRYPLK